MRGRHDGKTHSRTSRRSGPLVRLRLAAALEEIQTLPEIYWIFCPALARFPARKSTWSSVLATHDNNETLLEHLSACRKSLSANIYAGVLAIDPLRDTGQLIRQLKATGVAGVINFPSTSFIDGEAGTTLAQLGMGVDREIEFLKACGEAGLRTAGVAASETAATQLIRIGVDFLVLH